MLRDENLNEKYLQEEFDEFFKIKFISLRKKN